tara:strand:- start:5361 stop:7679 length:2319 start_codon:yes stop_codon:yes gene_type:complete
VFSSGVDTTDAICLNRQFDTIIYSANRDTATVLNLRYDSSTVFSPKGVNGWDSNYSKYALYTYGWLHDELKIYIDSSSSNCSLKIPIDTVKIKSGARWLSGTPFYANACGRKDSIDLDFLGPSPVLLTVKNQSNVYQTFHKFSAHDLCFGSNGVTIYRTCTNYKFSVKMADGCPAVEGGQLYNAGNWAFHVYVQPVYDPDTVHHLVCKGDSIQFSNYKMEATKSTFVTDYVEYSMGCDTNRTHSIKVIEHLDSAVFDTIRICPGDTAFFADSSYSLQATSDTTVINSNAICDSVIITMVLMQPTFVQNIQDSICHGQTYYFPDGDSATESVVDTSILQTVNGCDSSIITSLTVFYTRSNDTLQHLICKGDSVLIGNKYITNSSFVTDTVNSFCDTIKVHQVEVFDPYKTPHFVQLNICPGDTAYFADSTYATTAVTDTAVLKGANQCDSIIIATVNMLTPGFYQFSDTICSGNTYTFPDGDTSSTTKIDTSVFVGANGCDSIVVVDLKVNPTSLIQFNAAICLGSWYVFPDGDSSNSNGIDTSTFLNQFGCDSLIIVNLKINQPSLTNLQADVCQGDWYIFPDGDSSNKAVTDTSILSNQFGCDSVIYAQTKIINIDSSIKVVADTIEAISGYDSYQWLSCFGGGYAVVVGDTTHKLVPSSSGNYAVKIGEKHCVDASSCLAISLSPIIIKSVGEVKHGPSRFVYPNPFSELLTFDPALEKARIIIYNSLGQKVFEKTDVSGEVLELQLPEGKYVLEIQEDGISERFRLIRN